jgi:hypothetical protein
VTFTVREGPLIVGYGIIRSRGMESLPLPVPQAQMSVMAVFANYRHQSIPPGELTSNGATADYVRVRIYPFS